MKILIDIGHPAHVHYFRNMIKLMEKEGHEFSIIAKEKDITHNLLNHYRIPFKSRGKTGENNFSKLLKFPRIYFKIFKEARKFKPDLMIGISGIFIAPIGSLLRIPTIVIDDTEIARFAQKIYKPFAKKIITPSSFRKDFGEKQLRVNSLLDLLYLHPNYYAPNKSINSELGIKEGESFYLLRFISWNANHDAGVKGLSENEKIDLVNKILPLGKVFISSESKLPESLKPYEIKISPNKIHDVLSAAKLFWSESGTMSTEAAILGTPTIVLNSLAKELGCFHYLREKYDLLYFFDDKDMALQKFFELNDMPDIKNKWQTKKLKFLNEHQDFTKILIAEVKKIGKKSQEYL